MFETPVNKLTEAQLAEHYQALLRRENDVVNEQNRRRSLPHIWANETMIVQQLRAIGLVTPREEGEEWQEPTSIASAYLEGEIVSHEGRYWRAFGAGAIMHAPNTEDAVMGVRWEEVVPSETDNPDAEIIDAA